MFLDGPSVNGIHHNVHACEEPQMKWGASGRAQLKWRALLAAAGGRERSVHSPVCVVAAKSDSGIEH
jgi:hypothetical protein